MAEGQSAANEESSSDMIHELSEDELRVLLDEALNIKHSKPSSKASPMLQKLLVETKSAEDEFETPIRKPNKKVEKCDDRLPADRKTANIDQRLHDQDSLAGASSKRYKAVFDLSDSNKIPSSSTTTKNMSTCSSVCEQQTGLITPSNVIQNSCASALSTSEELVNISSSLKSMSSHSTTKTVTSRAGKKTRYGSVSLDDSVTATYSTLSSRTSATVAVAGASGYYSDGDNRPLLSSNYVSTWTNESAEQSKSGKVQCNNVGSPGGNDVELMEIDEDYSERIALLPADGTANKSKKPLSKVVSPSSAVKDEVDCKIQLPLTNKWNEGMSSSLKYGGMGSIGGSHDNTTTAVCKRKGDGNGGGKLDENGNPVIEDFMKLNSLAPLFRPHPLEQQQQQPFVIFNNESEKSMHQLQLRKSKKLRNTSKELRAGDLPSNRGNEPLEQLLEYINSSDNNNKKLTKSSTSSSTTAGSGSGGRGGSSAAAAAAAASVKKLQPLSTAATKPNTNNTTNNNTNKVNGTKTKKSQHEKENNKRNLPQQQQQQQPTVVRNNANDRQHDNNNVRNNHHNNHHRRVITVEDCILDLLDSRSPDLILKSKMAAGRIGCSNNVVVTAIPANGGGSATTRISDMMTRGDEELCVDLTTDCEDVIVMNGVTSGVVSCGVDMHPVVTAATTEPVVEDLLVMDDDVVVVVDGRQDCEESLVVEPKAAAAAAAVVEPSPTTTMTSTTTVMSTLDSAAGDSEFFVVQKRQRRSNRRRCFSSFYKSSADSYDYDPHYRRTNRYSTYYCGGGNGNITPDTSTTGGNGGNNNSGSSDAGGSGYNGNSAGESGAAGGGASGNLASSSGGGGGSSYGGFRLPASCRHRDDVMLGGRPHHHHHQRALDSRRKSTSSMPPSDHSSDNDDNSDLDSVHSLPVSSTTVKPTLAKTSSSSSSTPQASYADIAKMAAASRKLLPLQQQQQQQPPLKVAVAATSVAVVPKVDAVVSNGNVLTGTTTDATVSNNTISSTGTNVDAVVAGNVATNNDGRQFWKRTNPTASTTMTSKRDVSTSTTDDLPSYRSALYPNTTSLTSWASFPTLAETTGKNASTEDSIQDSIPDSKPDSTVATMKKVNIQQQLQQQQPFSARQSSAAAAAAVDNKVLVNANATTPRANCSSGKNGRTNDEQKMTTTMTKTVDAKKQETLTMVKMATDVVVVASTTPKMAKNFGGGGEPHFPPIVAPPSVKSDDESGSLASPEVVRSTDNDVAVVPVKLDKTQQLVLQQQQLFQQQPHKQQQLQAAKTSTTINNGVSNRTNINNNNNNGGVKMPPAASVAGKVAGGNVGGGRSKKSWQTSSVKNLPPVVMKYHDLVPSNIDVSFGFEVNQALLTQTYAANNNKHAASSLLPNSAANNNNNGGNDTLGSNNNNGGNAGANLNVCKNEGRKFASPLLSSSSPSSSTPRMSGVVVSEASSLLSSSSSSSSSSPTSPVSPDSVVGVAPAVALPPSRLLSAVAATNATTTTTAVPGAAAALSAAACCVAPSPSVSAADGNKMMPAFSLPSNCGPVLVPAQVVSGVPATAAAATCNYNNLKVVEFIMHAWDCVQKEYRESLNGPTRKTVVFYASDME